MQSLVTLLPESKRRVLDRHPIPKTEVSEKQQFDRARELALIHSMGKVLRCIAPHESHYLFEFHAQLADIALAVQQRHWLEIADAFERLKVRSLVLKGLHFLTAYYPPGERYLTNDIDVLVRPEHRRDTRAALEALGYTQSFVSHDGALIPTSESVRKHFEHGHYELFPFTKLVELPQFAGKAHAIREVAPGHPFLIDESRVFMALEVDVHHNLSPGLRPRVSGT
jgi:hypothetical protein